MQQKLLFSFGVIFMMKSFLAIAGDNKLQSELPSSQFREEHAEIKKHLSHIDLWTGKLRSSSKTAQKNTMMEIVSFFKEHIKPHAEWEEKKLYPAVDRRACSGAAVFTASMRWEHKIIDRWISKLERESSRSSPDAELFSRQTDQLLGLINAHFEEEEEVLLPILDRSMTPVEFKDEILSGREHEK